MRPQTPVQPGRTRPPAKSGISRLFCLQPGRSALTILEMLVSTALLSFIILGLTAVFIQTQRAFKTGIKQATVTDAGRTITDMIANDLHQMADAQNTNYGCFNFYCDWAASNQIAQTNILAGQPNQYLRTNELDEIFILVHTNNVWTGVGYAVSNVAVGVGTLYRYESNFNGPAPMTNYALFNGFSNALVNQIFSGNSNWHRLADGVVHLKVRAFDIYGNENQPEADDESDGRLSHQNTFYNYYYPGPYADGINPPTRPTTNQVPPYFAATLPSSVELELGILEPETLGQIQSLPGPAQGQWITNIAPSKEEIFRERVTIPVVVR